MARVSGIDLPDGAKIGYALTKIRGIGWAISKEILTQTKIKPEKTVKELSAEDIKILTKAIEKYTTEGDLARSVRSNIQRLQSIGSYRGLRHTRGLPARGQRTKSNARAKRGKRKTVGAFKKEELTKQPQVTT